MMTIRTQEPRELLALIPYQLGFRPTESAVVVSLRRGVRVGLVARVDLADLADPLHGAQLARALVGHLVADGATRVMLVLYSDDDLLTQPATGRRALAHLADAGDPYFPEPGCWVVGPAGYHGLDCTDPQCCPRPLVELESTRIGAEMVLLGAAVSDSRAALGQVPDPGESARRAARRAAARWAERGARVLGEPSGAHRWRRESLAQWRDLVAAGGGPATALGRVQAGLEDVLVRDAVLLDLVPGFPALADRVVAGWNGEEIGTALRAVIDPEVGVRPPVEQVERALAVLGSVAGHRPRGAVPALTLAALLSWWLGDGGRAAVLLERVLAERPDYRLAGLVAETLAAGLPPGWVGSDSD